MLVNPAKEAVIDNYYDVELADGTVVDHGDRVLGRFESDAAPVIERIVNDPTWTPNGPDVQKLLLYIVTLKTRTPQAREGLRESDRAMKETLFEAWLSDKERYHSGLGDSGCDFDELEATRLRLLADLRAGEITMEVGAECEVAMMLSSIEGAAHKLFDEIGVKCMRVPAEASVGFVVSDHPVAHYDPTPKTPEAGVSYMSSPKSVTLIALDPRVALLLVQGRPRSWEDEEARENDIDEANLLTYAWACDAIYGPSQFAVTRVRGQAKRSAPLLREFRYRPPRVWIGRGRKHDEVVEFTSRFKDQRTTRQFYVRPGAASTPIWPPERDDEPRARDASAASG